jgi:hypothetical protein
VTSYARRLMHCAERKRRTRLRPDHFGWCIDAHGPEIPCNPF